MGTVKFLAFHHNGEEFKAGDFPEFKERGTYARILMASTPNSGSRTLSDSITWEELFPVGLLECTALPSRTSVALCVHLAPCLGFF